MTINISCAGNIFNSEGHPVDANFQVFVYNSNHELRKWSPILQTENNDFNFNTIDDMLSGQENNLKLTDSEGEFIIIAAWDLTTPTKEEQPAEFSFIMHELKGDEIYVQDIHLGIPDPITCENWDITESIFVNETIIVTNNNTNEKTFYKDGTNYLYKKIHNETIFPFMGASIVEYDFGEGYSLSNIYSRDTGGELIVKIRVQDNFGTKVSCTKRVKIYYDIEPCFNYYPESIKIGDILAVSDCTSGNIDQIKNISYKVEDEVFEESFIRNKFTDSVEVTQLVTFWNGFTNAVKFIKRNISMDNTPPKLNLEVERTGPREHEYIFAHNGTDVDGQVIRVKWEVYRDSPDINGNSQWNLYYSTGELNDLSDWEFDFTDIIGMLKLKATVYDTSDGLASQEYIIDNTCEEPTYYFDNIDWDKKIIEIAFDANKISKIWETKTNKIQWSYNTIKKVWKLNTNKVRFKEKINKILFTASKCK